MKKSIFVVAGASLILGIFFLMGAVAHKACMFPFCRGYTDGAGAWLSFSGPAFSTQPFAVDEEGMTEMHADTLRTLLYEKVVARRYALNRRIAERSPGNHNARGSGRDGGIDVLGDHLLIASKDGDLFVLGEDRALHALPVAVPFSRAAFNSYVGGTKYASPGRGRASVVGEWFGVKDVLVAEDGNDRYRIFASYHHWNRADECFTLRVSYIPVQSTGGRVTAAPSQWEQVYETAPCLRLKDQKHPFAGLQAGGRMARLSAEEVLVTVGDHERDGMYGESLPQDASASYGKVILIDVEAGTSRTYTTGHRNAQGLHIDAQGRIWSTEHGPRGGDELNIIQEGSNYGWPLVTYGAPYGDEALYRDSLEDGEDWPPLAWNGSHAGFTKPVFTWGPSTGISQLTSVQDDLFARWTGDLLISSLLSGTLFRTRVRKGRVVQVEPIQLGERIRDLVEWNDGVIVLKTDGGNLIFLQPIGEPSPALS